MILLNGQEVANRRLESLKSKILKLSQKPGLTVVRIGEDPASKIYVQKKINTCAKVGINSQEKHLPADISQAKVVELIDQLNADKSVHGILVQLPVPKHLDTDVIVERVKPQKDVDGFHPYNLGRLMSQKPTTIACTPLGIMNLLADYKIEIAGKRAVVIGRSRIVGRPMSLLLDHAGATVTVVHSQTKNAEALIEEADIVVAALGKPRFVKKCKKGAVLVDVGINRLADGSIVGDLDFENLKDTASAMTPVPGGVGPMTIVTLLENTLKCMELQ